MSKDVINNTEGEFLTRGTLVPIKVNGKNLNTKAININTKLLVPLKEMLESHGAIVKINEMKSAATVHSPDYSLELAAGDTKVTINNQTTLTLDHEVMIENGEIFVSSRLALYVLKAKLGREKDAGIVTIDTLPESGLTVTSPAFKGWENIPHKFVQHSVGGENISMPIQWTGAPAHAKSFAMVIYDAHVLSEYWAHWAVINIDGSSSEIAENATGSLSERQQLKPYYGMQPAEGTGDHAYQIAVYALDVDNLDVPNQIVFLEDIASILEVHTIASGTLVGFFRS